VWQGVEKNERTDLGWKQRWSETERNYTRSAKQPAGREKTTPGVLGLGNEELRVRRTPQVPRNTFGQPRGESAGDANQASAPGQWGVTSLPKMEITYRGNHGATTATGEKKGPGEKKNKRGAKTVDAVLFRFGGVREPEERREGRREKRRGRKWGKGYANVTPRGKNHSPKKKRESNPGEGLPIPKKIRPHW